MKSDKKFSEFSQVVDELQQVAHELMQVMDNQTKAVIASNEQKIEGCAEKYTLLKWNFQEQEKKFISLLGGMVSPEKSRNGDFKLEQLIEVYPQQAQTIRQWEDSLGTLMQRLKRKHQKLNELLEFALHRNAEFMHSIYRLHSQKNYHYSSDGDKTEIASGMAVNKEA